MRSVIALMLIFSLSSANAAHRGENPHLWHTPRAADFSDDSGNAEIDAAVRADVREATAQVDAGVTTLDIIYPCPEAEPLQRIDGGYIVTDARAARLACQLAACQEHRDALRRTIDDTEPPLPIAELPPSWQTWTMGIVIAVFGGAVFGVWLGLRIRD